MLSSVVAARAFQVALLAGALLLGPVRSVRAQETPEWVKNISLSGKTYLRYSYELGDARKDYNEFAIDRLYVIFVWKLWDRARLRYTLEGGEIRDVDVKLSNGTLTKTSNQALGVVTKHLYFEYSNPLGKDSFLRLGLADLPFVPYEEDVWGYRVQGTVFSDRGGYLTSTDLGVAVGGRFAKEYGSWQASLVNGEGWKRSEAGKHKDMHARLTFNPLAGAGTLAANFFITGFYSKGTYDDVTTGPTSKNRTILMGGYKSAGKVTLAGEYMMSTDPASSMAGRYPSLTPRAGLLSEARGTSVFFTLSPKAFGATGNAEKLDFLARYDALDPDNAIADNSLRRVIAGFAYKLHQKMTALLTMEDVKYDAQAGKPNERRVLLQTEIRF